MMQVSQVYNAVNTRTINSSIFRAFDTKILFFLRNKTRGVQLFSCVCFNMHQIFSLLYCAAE